MTDTRDDQNKPAATVTWELDFAVRKLKGAFPHLSRAEITEALEQAKRDAAPAETHDDIIRRAEQKLTE